MIRHNPEFINIDTGIMIRDFIPYCLNHAACVGQTDFRGNTGADTGVCPYGGGNENMAQQTFPVLHAYRDKIGPGPCVIIIAQADGTAMVDVGVVFHGRLFTTGRVVGAGPRACPVETARFVLCP
ncbi:MAG: hypothetical protein D3906_15895, partial [Candidatus Electrothrix sp. AUS1_2]|nr:hypothetical protein [Candidatus Electrothrix sp. AUS1_2]